MTTKTEKKENQVETFSRVTFIKELQDSLEGRLSEVALRLIPSATDLFIETISNSLKNKVSVRLKGLGVLNVYYKNARKGVRNVKTKEPAEVSARWVVSFKLGRSDRAKEIMAWSDINEIIYAGIPQLTRKDVAVFHEGILALIGRVAEGDFRTEFRDFGSFYPSFLEGRVRYNPVSGERKQVPAKIQIGFRSYLSID